jgi:hypothetical protein
MTKLRKASVAAGVLLLLGVAAASAGELPQYEVAGFPISPHQISVLGLSEMKEGSPTPTLTLNGMPAAPHQIAVLQPRAKRQIADKPHEDRAAD